jgi:hypothetical protein
MWSGFERLKAEIANFVIQKGRLSDYIKQQQQDIKGIAKQKSEAFEDLTKLTVSKAQKAYVWAIDSNNAEYIEIFDIQKSDFEKISQDVAFSRIKNVRDSINTNIGTMQGVLLTASDVTALDNAITAYSNTLGTPGLAQSIKQDGTKGIEEMIEAVDKSIDIIAHLIVSEYTISNPDNVKEFLFNRQTDDLPTHHSGLYVMINEISKHTGTESQPQKEASSAVNLQGAVVSIDGTGKTAGSDINGIAEIIKVKPGTYNVTVTLLGYKPQTIKTEIERGRVKELVVEMEKNG